MFKVYNLFIKYKIELTQKRKIYKFFNSYTPMTQRIKPLTATSFKTIIILLVVFVWATSVFADTTIDFNSTSDLTNNFNPSSSHVFTNESNGGLNNSGSVNFHPSTTEAWTHKTGVAVPGLNETLTLSAYFYNAHNAGYSGLGFAVDATNEAGTLAKITSSSALGMCFHGGGGYFFNNSDEISTTWGGGDLSLSSRTY